MAKQWRARARGQCFGRGGSKAPVAVVRAATNAPNCPSSDNAKAPDAALESPASLACRRPAFELRPLLPFPPTPDLRPPRLPAAAFGAAAPAELAAAAALMPAAAFGAAAPEELAATAALMPTAAFARGRFLALVLGVAVPRSRFEAPLDAFAACSSATTKAAQTGQAHFGSWSYQDSKAQPWRCSWHLLHTRCEACWLHEPTCSVCSSTAHLHEIQRAVGMPRTQVTSQTAVPSGGCKP